MKKSTQVKLGLPIVLAMAPLGALTIRHWMDGLFILASVLAIFILVSDRDTTENNSLKQLLHQPWIIIICFAMTSPFLAVLISQLFRQEFELSYFDSPFRFILFIPLLFALLATYQKPVLALNYSFPAAVLLTFGILPLLPHTGWAVAQPGRITSYFVDPLTFGRMALELSMISVLIPLTCDSDHQNKRFMVAFIKLVVLIAGLLLSIRTGSRTGWLAMPFVTVLWVVYCFRNSRKMAIVMSFALVGVLSYSFMHMDTFMNRRFNLAVQEFKAYQWKSMNKDESIPMRISFVRIGIDLFKLKPLSGWGDRGFEAEINDAEIRTYSSDFTRQYALSAGFHNELITNMVRSGVWGMLSTLLIFFVPLLYFSRCWTRSKENIYAFCGICFIFFEVASGLSTEVTNLKFTAAYYSYMVVILFFQSYRFVQTTNRFSLHPSNLHI